MNGENKAMTQHQPLTLKALLDKPEVQATLRKVLNKNVGAFTTSVLQIANSNAQLKQATPVSVYSAACLAATLNLPINANLGMAYIVPYYNNKKGVMEAQFQMGWRGFVQLAQRTNLFATISTAIVHEGQLVKYDPLKGHEFNWDFELSGKPVIGYVAYFRLLNGMESFLYMDTKQVLAHAQRYSQTFKRGTGIWADNFDAMALKTVIKLLLSRYAPLTVELSTAIQSDQTVINDGEVTYVDNAEGVIEEGLPPMPDEYMARCIAEVANGKQADDVIEIAGKKYSVTQEEAEKIRAAGNATEEEAS